MRPCLGLLLLTLGACDAGTVERDPLIIEHTGSFVHALNEGTVAQADLALETGARTQNLAYALIIGHLQANVHLVDVMNQYGVDLVSSDAETKLVEQIDAGVERLRQTPSARIDREFLDLQIRVYSNADAILDKLESQLDSEPMADYLVGYHAMIDDHLGRARELFATFDD